MYIDLFSPSWKAEWKRKKSSLSGRFTPKCLQQLGCGQTQAEARSQDSTQLSFMRVEAETPEPWHAASQEAF